MITLNPYLNFPGNTEEAFIFYRSVFGGEFVILQRFKDTEAGANMSAEDGERIMHIALPIGKSTILMATDALASQGHTLTTGTNFSLCISPETEEDANKYFAALGEGGTVSMPLEKMFWGAYFGMLTDKFGIQWMVNYDYAKKSYY